MYDTIHDADGTEKRVLNTKETMLAQQKQEMVREAFKSWVWKDPERREVLCQKYNEIFNSIKPREYDGSHIRFTGMTPEIKLRSHQPACPLCGRWQECDTFVTEKVTHKSANNRIGI